MRIPAILAISLAAVLAGSLLLVGPLSLGSISPEHDDHVQQAQAQALPLVVRDRFTAMQMAGDGEAGSRFLKVDEEFIDPENHCEFCTRVEYVPGPQGEAGFSYEDVTGLDLSGSERARFWVMGEEGNEKIKFKLAGKSLDKIQDRLGRLTDRLTDSIFKSERFALTTEEVSLDNQWKKYEVDLSGVDLKGITHPFAFELSENSAQKQVIYIKGVVYDDEPAVDALVAVEEEVIDPLAAEIISNATEGVAPATFEFEANVTGGTEPYGISWDFGGDGESDEQTATHTFDEAGTYNVTLQVTDADELAAADSLEIVVEEPEIEEEVEQADNSTDAAPANASSAVTEEEEATDEQDGNATGSEQEATEEEIELQVDAGIDVVAQPGDEVVLVGEVTGVDGDADGLSYEWTQASGPEVEIDGGDSLDPEATIPEDIDEDEEIELQFAASLGSAEDSDSITIFVEHVDEVEGAQEERLEPAESAIAEWDDECDDLADCMADGSDDTFASASPGDASDVSLFSFEEFDINGAEIEYVTAIATARSDETGYLLFVGADSGDEEDRSESPGAVSIASDSFEEYEYVWEENPIVESAWTAESLNSFLAGYSYGDGESDIEVSEFILVVTYTVEEPEPAENLAEEVPELLGNSTAATNSTGE
ncbi:MAG TPA: PKD domain-containing protein [Nitrososphaera sp.]|nr:PKD domain-containing protein [Nitrososphaera sp.]